VHVHGLEWFFVKQFAEIYRSSHLTFSPQIILNPVIQAIKKNLLEGVGSYSRQLLNIFDETLNNLKHPI